MSIEATRDYYQMIGREAADMAEGRSGKLIIYSEVEEGVISGPDVFYEVASGAVKYLYATDHLRDLIWEFWDAWRNEVGNQEWRTITYVIDGEKFRVELKYPEEIDQTKDYSDRRPRVLTDHFGDKAVDYSAAGDW